MELPLIELECTCGYEDECSQIKINDKALKGLIYLMGSRDGKDFALMMANRKLKREGGNVEQFTSFVNKVKHLCPYYQYA